MRFIILSLIISLFSSVHLQAQQNEWPEKRDTSDIIGKWLFKQYCDSFPEIYMMPEWYDLQIIYVQVNRDSSGFPHLSYHQMGVDNKQYFYPASLVKLPTLLLTLEKLNELNPKYKIDKYSRIKIGKDHSCQTEFKEDTTGLEGYPTIANFIRRILLVSDNQAYSRLFEFMGQEDLNRRMWAKGYTDNIILKRFTRCDYDENRYTNPFWFYHLNGDVAYYQKARTNPNKWKIPYEIDTRVGKGWMDWKTYRDKPKDFRYTNRITLESELDMMIRFILPEIFDSTNQWHISQQDRLFLLQYFSMYPRQSPISEYHDYEEYEDSYKKYFMIGDTKDTIYDENLKIFNIVGLSYGFLSDIAYIVNLEEGVEFFLAAVIYTNQDDILNNDQYEYHEVGFPFFGKFGRIVYEYERKRPRTYRPDFWEIKTALGLPPL
ncbi:MAG: serine hydrolase [Bacteroidales bacterium]|nr:serine hydrolase [Bacteroidales bacterium]